MSKKVLLPGLVVFSVIFLSGCSKDQEQETKKEQNQVQKQEQAEVASGEGKEIGENPPEGSRGGAMMNSEEAIAACSDLSEGDECSFSITNENEEEAEVAGNCKSTPQPEDSEESSSELVCMPAKGNGGGPGGMPPGAPE